MKNLIYTTLLLCFCLLANGQDYLKLAGDCFNKGDYECAKQNYTLFQTIDGRNMSAQIKNAEECFRILIIADEYFNDKDYEKAKERYKALLDINPNDPNAKKQYDLCEERLQTPIISSMKDTDENILLEKEPLITKKEKSIHFGVKAGLNISTININQTHEYDDYSNYRAGLHGGVFAEFKFNNFAFQPELLYFRQSVTSSYRIYNKDFISFPLMAKYYVNGIDGLSIEIGPQIDTNITSGKINFSLNIGASYQITRTPLGFYVCYFHDISGIEGFMNRVFQVGAFVKF